MALTVAIDLDGVLHSYTRGWTGPYPEDDPNPGAVEFVEGLIADGFRVVIMTTRASTIEGEAAVFTWLEHHGFPPLEVTSKKIPAIAYVDDRAVPFVGDWEATRNGVVHFKNEVKRKQQEKKDFSVS